MREEREKGVTVTHTLATLVEVGIMWALMEKAPIPLVTALTSSRVDLTPPAFFSTYETRRAAESTQWLMLELAGNSNMAKSLRSILMRMLLRVPAQILLIGQTMGLRDPKRCQLVDWISPSTPSLWERRAKGALPSQPWLAESFPLIALEPPETVRDVTDEW